MHTNNIDSPPMPKWKQRGSVPIGELTHTANKMAKKGEISKLDIKIQGQGNNDFLLSVY